MPADDKIETLPNDEIAVIVWPYGAGQKQIGLCFDDEDNPSAIFALAEQRAFMLRDAIFGTALRAEVAALRQQLDEARGKINRVNDELRAYGIEYPLGAAGVHDLASMAAGRLEELQTAEAHNARLLDVYRAAEAWRDWWATLRPQGGMFAPENGLAAAVDRARRAGAPAEALPETIMAAEGTRPRSGLKYRAEADLDPVELPRMMILELEDGSCGCCLRTGEHECGSECDSCDGSGRQPDSPICRLPHGADCRCTNAQRLPAEAPDGERA